MRAFAATLAVVWMMTTAGVAAQPLPPAPGPLRVFVACGFCDLDFLRQEITYVEHVRDRLVSDVHVVVAREAAGEGTAISPAKN